MTSSPTDGCQDRIAIIGIGCRFPGGARDHRSFWRNLIEGRDCVTPTPADRYDVATLASRDPAKPGRLVGGRGGYIDGVAEFDPEFFGISPREAAHMDPQQRKLLEVAWEALEDGGQLPGRLAGCEVGVYMGAFTLDYKILQFADLGFEGLSAHTATGTMMTMVSNRVSHCFDFRGPSISIDTACSSSLVALHLARQSLLRGETDLALAGGALLHLAPQYTIAETKGGFLSGSGRSRAFDAAADGYVRAEGVGVVALKRLADALRDGDPVHAVVLGSGVNQDGRTDGITVPSADAQTALIRRVCSQAGVAPGALQYVEAHGTSTPVGDPIEADALGRVLAIGRPPGARTYVGSVKTNIGHTEAAAGVAGLIKTVLALKHRRIPPHLHLERPSTAIDWDALPFEVPTRAVDWPEHEGPARAGVNSFGFGGTNAHVLLEEAPAPRPADVPARLPAWTVLPLSARSPEALPELVAGIRQELAGLGGPGGLHGPNGPNGPNGPRGSGGADSRPATLSDLGHTLARRREHHEHRLSIVYSPASPESLDQALAAHQRGEPHPRVLSGRRRERAQRRLAWVFTGMGPQWWGMGRGLFGTEPVYREAVERCDAEIRRQAGWSLLNELARGEADSRMSGTWLAQPANFAVQVGLAALWRSYGVRPDAVVGHSTGEVAAFHEAGVYGLADAVAVVLHRSRLQQRLAGTGTMLAVGLTEPAAVRRIRDCRDRVSVAAVNGPSDVTLSGDRDTLERLAAQLGQEQVFARFLPVEVPYHSVRMDPIRDELLAGLAGIKPVAAEVPLYLTAREGRAHGAELDAGYWWQNVREPVRFQAAVEQLVDDGHRLFLEIGPHPVLGHAIRDCLDGRGLDGTALPSIRRRQDEPESVARSLAELHNHGAEVDWQALHPGGRPVPLPGYPWRRDRYWTEPAPVAQIRLGRLDHPLLGRRTTSAQPSWEVQLDLERLPYLADHRIQDSTVFPAAGYLEMASQAVRVLTGTPQAVLADVELPKALFLSQSRPSRVQLHFDPDTAAFTIASAGADASAERTVHATGTVRSAPLRPPGTAPDLSTIRSRARRRLDRTDCYRELAALGYHYGPAFQRVEEVWIGPEEALARIHPAQHPPVDATGSHVHPTLLDACFHALLVPQLLAEHPAGGIRLPLSVQAVSLGPVGDQPFWAHATITGRNGGELTGDLALYADDGTALGRITGFRAADVEHAAASVSLASIDGWLAEPTWAEEPLEAVGEPPDRLLVLADSQGLAEQLAERVRAGGGSCHLVRPGDTYRHGPDGSTVRPGSAADLRRLFGDLDDTFGTVVHLWNLDLPTVDSADRQALARCGTHGGYSLIALAQVLPSARPEGRLHIVTRGTQAVVAGDPVEPLGAPAWGIGRVLGQQELVAHKGKLIDLGLPADLGAEAAALLRELASDDADEVALRGGLRSTSRLSRPGGLTRPLPLRLRPDGSYLVTGAFGALGQVLCRTLAKRGARRLILVGRTPLPERDQWEGTDPDTPAGRRVAFLQELEALGAHPVQACLDVTDEDALTGWLADHRRRRLPPVRGVFHLAGQVSDALVGELDRAVFDAAYDPKVVGAYLLHRHLRDEPLDHFVLFASIASLLTTAGQANYAAGNAFLDALAHHRHARGLPALSIDWGPWATGMIEELGLVDHYRHARGMSSLPPAAGMAVLERVIGQDRPQLLVATVVDWPTFQAWYASPPPLVAGLVAAATAEAPAAPEGGFPAAFRAAGAEERRTLVAERFTGLVCEVLRVKPERVDPATGLTVLGLDSLLAMELRARARAELGVAPPVVALLGGNPVGELIEQLHTGLLELAVCDGSTPETTVELVSDAGRYPLTYNQKALWFLKQLNPDAFAYNIGGAVEVRAELDPELMFRAFAVLLERHPSLRATFTLDDGRPVQVISAQARPDTALFDVAGREWDDIHRMIVGEYRKPYDLEHDPLIRFRLFRRAPDRWVIMKAVHHIVSDAISTFTFIEELFAAYDALRHGRPVLLPPPAATYLDFVNHQNRFLAGPDARRMLDHWRDRLPDPIPVLALPTDRPRPPVLTHNGASEFFRLDPELTAAVHTVAREHNATPFMVLLSAYYLLLHRWSGQDDLIVGSPVSGRTREEDASVYGYYVNPLPLYVSLEGEPTVAELLARVRDTVLGGLDNQEYPFVLLVEELGLQHDPSRSAVFQAMFILLTHKVATERRGYRLEYIELPEEEGQFDVTLSAYEDQADHSFHCVLKYNTDLFDAQAVRRLARHYRTLLAGLTSGAADRPVSRIPMLGEAERARILTEWSGAARPARPEPPVTELFAKAAAVRPEALAISVPGGHGPPRRLTYGELDQLSGRMAGRLRELGAGAGTVVAVCLDKSPELVASLLAVLRAGAAYLPLDPDHPAERLAQLAADARAVLVIADRPGRFGTPVVTPADLAAAVAQAPGPAVDPDLPAYVIHTSGSTGRPKAVRVSHRNLASAYAGWREEYRLDDDVRVHLQLAGVSFDVFTGDLVRALCSGATLVLADRELLFDTARLYEAMREERVDCAEFVPALARGLLAYCEREGLRLDFMRLLIVGSDTWKVADHRRLRALCGPDTRLVNSYGLTEATIDSTFFDGPDDGLEPGHTLPVGRPFPGSEVYILDRHGEPVPPGVPGELWIGGAGVADGYPGDPRLTAERFTTRSPDGVPQRLYRTGDLGHWDTDGRIHLRGRADSQVKLRGHRIEPGEIEAHLAAVPELAQACVAVRRDPAGDDVLCAYCVPASDAVPDHRTLRRHLAERLPTHLVPSHFVMLPSLPLTANGKVDTAALPAPGPQHGPDRHEPPASRYEVSTAEHWKTVLGVEQVGLEADFFELGGSSIKLIELIHHLRTEFAVSVPVGLLFRGSTLHGMARTVEHVVTGRIAGTRPFLCFNEGAARGEAVFCFPPAGGHGLVYRQFADALPEYRIVAFDYLTGDDKTARYADLVGRQADGRPVTLIGYSLGGNLAFETAKELERRGRAVSAVVILDSHRVPEPYTVGPEHLAAFEHELADHLHRHTGSAIVARETMEQARDYLEFCARTPNVGTVGAPVIVITDQDALPDHAPGRRGSWHGSSATRTEVLQGSGQHAEMLDGEHVRRNADLARSLLARDGDPGADA
ncbi:non-ribosomal peptide synthetase/type I polyketide synthase [Streptantibioticus silvisoli]|uniref:Amino acid adenylation domain-containing protein n=1 Tax=Streptantibioticus silvisoli TaxID=2705255 RepID=A0ABT6W524_9ACTN|nr:non-ribosomal peptide synthetase/type I polyketide synthase [Streptantibioticus silvisoli]MDI5965470.1 amino acid adenylation domain-containing protein [Streptantibioticus silvisoli]